MHILHLVHQYPPDYMSGTELYTQMLATNQANEGHTVSVFCPAPDGRKGDAPTATMEQGVRIHRVPLGPRSRTQIFKDTFRQAQLQDGLTAILKEEPPDIVHIQHLMGMPLSLIDPVLTAGLPYVVTLHDYWYVCANAQLITNTDQTICQGPDRLAINCGRCALARAGKKNAGWLAPAIAPIMGHRNKGAQAILEHADRVIAPTTFVRQRCNAMRIDNENIVVVRHGINLPAAEVEVARRHHEARRPDGRLHIGYVGSIGRQKGVHVLIEAVNDLPSDHVQLTIYGDLATFPEYVSQLKQMIHHPSIILAGSVVREKLWLALAEFDVFVFPTLWFEVSPMTIDEAFAVGVPVLASRIGAMNEKIADGINGRLFAPGDVNALRDILSELIMVPGTLVEWRRNIEPLNTIYDHIRALEEIYTEALNTV